MSAPLPHNILESNFPTSQCSTSSEFPRKLEDSRKLAVSASSNIRPSARESMFAGLLGSGTNMGISCRNPVSVYLCLVLLVSCSLALVCSAANTITQGQVIRDGETVISASQNFELGFFSPENSTLRYVGIWYKASNASVLWVANREHPLSGRDGILSIGGDGNLNISNGSGAPVWSSNVSTVVSNNSTAILKDSGNLILLRSDDVDDANKAYWQSFDIPTDTFLPGMLVQTDGPDGERRVFTSWKTPSDPSPGNYSMGIDSTQSVPQVVIWDQSNRLWRSGYWTGISFTGIPGMRAVFLYGFRVSKSDNGGVDFSYTSPNSSALVRFWLRWDGIEEQLSWDHRLNKWSQVQTSEPADDCEVYNKCGSFGQCNPKNSPICSCIHGFEPSHMDQWQKGNWSGGCVRKTHLQCERNNSSESTDVEDEFLEVKGVKLPDFVNQVESEMQRSEVCEEECLKSCSCSAYAIVRGIGCMIWSGHLVDIQHFAQEGRTLYVRLHGSELGGKSKISNAVIIGIVVAGIVVLSLFIFLVWRFQSNLKAFSYKTQKSNVIPLFDMSKSGECSTEFSGPDDLVAVEGNQVNGPELQVFNFTCVVIATDHFSDANKLGKGGFGPVYKGTLPGGQEIAVKRLAKRSGQGLEEFKNEIILIAKLQHRNLVRLLGCCIEEEEKMLIYEYMPNKSLDCFLFDAAKQAELNWRKRFTIIEGIARGLLYLHRDSRLRIIHRDLKASNILLDKEMNPKISDFGMARIFGGNQYEANTNRVVGTYGYMSPEYAMEGLFSIKSDVYSFGVLLLEIVSGRRNTSFRLHEHSSLIGYAWDLWNKGSTMELVDPSLGDSCNRSEALRCIHVGMLCVQDSAAHRPTMASVLMMLESETAALPVPRKPTYTSQRGSVDIDCSVEACEIVSSNDVTVTTIVGR